MIKRVKARAAIVLPNLGGHPPKSVWEDIVICRNDLMTLNMQIMPEVFILGCIYALPAYRDLMRAEGPKHIPIF